MSNPVTIKILDREYTVGCPPERVSDGAGAREDMAAGSGR